MASKRAVQLGVHAHASVIGRRTSRLRFNATQAFSLALRQQSTSASQSRLAILGSTSSVQLAPVQKRWHSQQPPNLNKVYQFEDVRSFFVVFPCFLSILIDFAKVLHILEHPSDSRLLIDVREPHEFEANTIPTSINIPVTSQPDALLLSEEDFEDRFGFQKPPKGKEVVFFCKAGVRSSAAAGIARQAG